MFASLYDKICHRREGEGEKKCTVDDLLMVRLHIDTFLQSKLSFKYIRIFKEIHLVHNRTSRFK